MTESSVAAPDLGDRVEDVLDRVLGERALELFDEIARFVLLAGEGEEREREEEKGDEREDREVRDHRRQVRAAVGEKLSDDGCTEGRESTVVC